MAKGPQPQFGRKTELDEFQRKAARSFEARGDRNQMGFRPIC